MLQNGLVIHLAFFQACSKGELNVEKELPRVNRTLTQLITKKCQPLGYSVILLELCRNLVTFYKNLHFTNIVHFTRKCWREIIIVKITFNEKWKSFKSIAPPPFEFLQLKPIFQTSMTLYIIEVDRTNWILYIGETLSYTTFVIWKKGNKGISIAAEWISLFIYTT